MNSNISPILALIPARGGSKGISRKNLALVCSRPLVWHTLRAAQMTPCVSEVWLSSDDDEILAIGSEVGVHTLKRPLEFSNDEASAVFVVQHFLNVLSVDILALDPIVLYLQPTSPMRNASHIIEALELMQQEEAKSVVSVVAQRHSPFKSFRLDSRGRLQSLFDETLSNARRQDLPQTYIPNGAIYGFYASEFNSRRGFPSNDGAAYIMSERESLDVDTPEDLEKINAMMGEKNA